MPVETGKRASRSGVRIFRIDMFTVSVETNFLASHQLVLLDGCKEPLHQHNWLVAAEVSSNRLNSMGLVIDFRQLKSMLDNIASELDNMVLDKIDYFHRTSASAENVAKYIYEKLGYRLPKGVKLKSVSVVEEPGCSAKFTGGQQHKNCVWEDEK